MSSHSKRTTSIAEKIFTIVTLACIVLATILAVWECCKITKAGFQLVTYNISTTIYNEDQGKSEILDEAQKKDNEKRQAIYNSEDTVIRTFSNLPFIPKLVIWILSIITIPLVPILEIMYVIDVMVPTKRRSLRTRKEQSC